MTVTQDPELKVFVEARLAELRAREPEIPFPQEEYDARLSKLRGRMHDAGIDLLLVSSPEGACLVTV